MQNKIIYIEIDEEITSIIDRITESESEQLILVVPKGAKLFQSVVNLKFLKKESERIGKEIIMVASDPVVAALIKEVGLPVKEKLEFGEDIEPNLDGWPGENEYHKPPVKVYDIIGPGTSFSKIVPAIPKKKPVYNEETEVKISLRSADTKKVEKDFSVPEIYAPEEIEETPEIAQSKDYTKPEEIKPAGQKTRKIEEEFLSGIDVLPEFLSQNEERDVRNEPNIKRVLRRTPSFSLNVVSDFFSGLIGKIFSGKAEETVSDIISEDRALFGSKLLSPRPFKILILFIIVSVIITASSFYFILPSAKVEVVSKKDKLNFDFTVSVDKNISQISGDKIPGQLVQIEKTLKREFSATGKKTAAAQKAKGIITVYNAFGTSPQSLIATTRFLSSSGKLFRLDESIVVPAAKIENGKIIPSSIDAKVTADQSGEEYNIGPSDFTIPGFQGGPKYAGFYGKSKSEMTGGSTGGSQTASTDDAEKAKEELTNELKEQLHDELLTKIPSDLKFLEDAQEESVSFSVVSLENNGNSGKFEARAKMTLKALLFKESDLNIWLDQNMNLKVPENFILVTDTRNVIYSRPDLKLIQGVMSLPFNVEQQIIGKIDEKSLKSLLAGKDKEEIRGVITQEPGIESAVVTFWPFWVSKAPVSTNKIKITIQ